MSGPLDAANDAQSQYWNGEAGRRWTQLQESQDRLFAAFTDALFAAAAPQPGEGVIDVGCGAGDTTIRAAKLTGRALGIDVSEPLLGRARERAAEAGAPARFSLADATVYDLSGEAADLMISRFGVMFFAEPARSFANLRRGLKPGARLAFLCWREPKLNPWLMAPYRAAQKHLPPQPKPGPDDPGPFSFADETRVRGILEAAGFAELSFTAQDAVLDIADGKGLENALSLVLAIGPTSRALADQPEAIHEAVRQELRAMLAEHLRGDTVPLDGAVWIVQARA